MIRPSQLAAARDIADATLTGDEKGLRLAFIEAWAEGGDWRTPLGILRDWLEERGYAEWRAAAGLVERRGPGGAWEWLEVVLGPVDPSWRWRHAVTPRSPHGRPRVVTRVWPSPTARESARWFLGFPPGWLTAFPARDGKSLAGRVEQPNPRWRSADPERRKVERHLGPAGFAAAWWPKGAAFDRAGRVVNPDAPDLFAGVVDG